jgi:hypothetical protein
MSKTQILRQKRASKLLTVLLLLTGCSGTKDSNDGIGSPAPQSDSQPTSDALPQINADNSTKCGDILVSRNSKIDVNICEARTQVTSVMIDTFLTSKEAANLGAKGIFLSLVYYNGIDSLKDGEVYKLMSKRDPHDGRIIVPDSAKTWAAAAYGDGPMTNQQLQGSLSFTKVPRKAGDSFEVIFDLVSPDGKVNVAGKASGVATDSPLMKPDNN